MKIMDLLMCVATEVAQGVEKRRKESATTLYTKPISIVVYVSS